MVNPVGLLSLAIRRASLLPMFIYRRFLDGGSLAADGRPADPDGTARRETLPASAAMAFAVRTAGTRTTPIRT